MEIGSICSPVFGKEIELIHMSEENKIAYKEDTYSRGFSLMDMLLKPPIASVIGKNVRRGIHYHNLRSIVVTMDS